MNPITNWTKYHAGANTASTAETLTAEPNTQHAPRFVNFIGETGFGCKVRTLPVFLNFILEANTYR